ncbi:MAG: hypothetical protein WA809_08860, partial [Candidatus Dormiibacterota bacterium]
MTEGPISGTALEERDPRLLPPGSRPKLSQAQHQTAEVVANLAWDKALVGSRPHLGLPARFTLRAAGPAGREGARA